MADVLLGLARNTVARSIIKRLSLPLPLPETLRRARGPWAERELDGLQVLVAAGPRPALVEAIAATLARDGAAARLTGMTLAVAPFAGPAEAWSRPLETWATVPAGAKLDGVVLDASGLSGPEDLAVLHRSLGPALGALARSGRVLVLGRPDAAMPTAAGAAAMHALDGFVRSLAKEVGRVGATAQRVLVAPGSEARLPAVLRWLLSARSAWMTGQTILVDQRAADAADADEPPRTRPLAGKTAVVTGAARGIGAAIATRFSAEGAHVIAVDRPGDEGPLSELCRAIGALPLSLDVTAPNAAEVLRSAGEDALDVIVHNAGLTRDKTLARMRPEHWDEAVQVNLGAVVRVTDALAARGLADGARVVCLSSVAGIAGNFGQTNYAAAKAGLIGYVGWLGAQAALGARGITVNALAPGFVETRLTAAIPAVTRELGRRMAALGQGGVPDDVAELCLFLASPGAVGITGQTLRICGGNFFGA